MAKQPTKYDLKEVTRGLTAVALANGNCRQAHRDLAAAGHTVALETLRRWKTRNQADYERIRREILPQVGADVAEEHMAVARKNIEIEHKIAERLEKEVGEIPARELSNALRNAATSAGIHTSRARELQGDFATPPAHVRDATEVIRALVARGVMIEGEATEIETPQLETGQ